MDKPKFWRYYWVNCRIFLLTGLAIGLLFSAAWSFQGGSINLGPLVLFGAAPALLMLIGTYFQYRRYLTNLNK